jgi:hypothetical protein
VNNIKQKQACFTDTFISSFTGGEDARIGMLKDFDFQFLFVTKIKDNY